MKTIIIDGIEYNLIPKVLLKKGDFVVIQETTYLISKIEGLNVTLSCNGRECLFDIDVLKNARLWDITKDAKDGDVLHCWIDGDEFVLIYKGIKDGYITTYGHLYQKLKSFSEEPTSMFCRTIQGHFTPATKEQRNALIKVMADAGYIFDFEKKKLKRIEQNSAWSKEDENTIKDIIEDLEYAERKGYVLKNNTFIKEIHWLKSLKDRVQPKQEWSEEDEEHIESILMRLDGMCKKGATFTETCFAVNQDMDWLRSL